MPFEDYITTGSIYRYNLICSIDAHDKIHPTKNDDTSSGGGILLPYNSTKIWASITWYNS